MSGSKGRKTRAGCQGGGQRRGHKKSQTALGEAMVSLTPTAVCISCVDTLLDPKAWGLSQEATSLSLWFGWPMGGGGGKGRKVQIPVVSG